MTSAKKPNASNPSTSASSPRSMNCKSRCCTEHSPGNCDAMKNYYRVMLGQKSVHADECFSGNFIGTDFGINQNLTKKLPDEWRAFNKEFIPVFLATHPDKTKIGAGLACGALWTVSKGIQKGDIVLCPDGTGRYRVGEVTGDYYYEPGKILFHRRPVTWLNVT